MSNGVPEPAKDGDGLGRAPVGVGRDADVQRLALLNGRVQCTERFLERGGRVEAVVIEDVDVVDAQALQALIKAREEVLARAKIAVRSGPHVPSGFGRDHQLITERAKVRAQDATEVRLGAAVRRSVVVGQVEVGDAEVEGAAQDGALSVDRAAIAEVLPQPERDGGEQKPAASAAAVAHRCVTIGRGEVAARLHHFDSR